MTDEWQPTRCTPASCWTAKLDPLPFVGGEDLTQLYEYRPQLFQRQPQLLRIRVRLLYVGDLPSGSHGFGPSSFPPGTAPRQRPGSCWPRARLLRVAVAV